MHTCPGRNEYIKIIWENMKDSHHDAFKEEDSSYATKPILGYDYESIMHYSSYASSKNQMPTIVRIVGHLI